MDDVITKYIVQIPVAHPMNDPLVDPTQVNLISEFPNKDNLLRYRLNEAVLGALNESELIDKANCQMVNDLNEQPFIQDSGLIVDYLRTAPAQLVGGLRVDCPVLTVVTLGNPFTRFHERLMCEPPEQVLFMNRIQLHFDISDALVDLQKPLDEVPYPETYLRYIIMHLWGVYQYDPSPQYSVDITEFIDLGQTVDYVIRALQYQVEYTVRCQEILTTLEHVPISNRAPLLAQMVKGEDLKTQQDLVDICHRKLIFTGSKTLL